MDLNRISDEVWLNLSRDERMWRAVASAHNLSKVLNYLKKIDQDKGYRLLEKAHLDSPWTPEIILHYHDVLTMGEMIEFLDDNKKDKLRESCRIILKEKIMSKEELLDWVGSFDF